MKKIAMFTLASVLVVLPVDAQQPAGKGTPLAAAMRLNEPGPEQKALAADVGRWDVVAKLWPAANAEPIVTTGLVAERKLIGPFLQETMTPAKGSRTPDFQRLDYLSFDRVEGRWKYVSMDTRFPVSIMPASGFRPRGDGRIELQFAPQAFVGFSDVVEGRFMLSDMIITHNDAEHMVKEQHIIMADGANANWTLARYEYTRQRAH